MSLINNRVEGERLLMMGNEAIARGALEAGVKVVAAYPGTPSSEIPTVLGEVAEEFGIYVEWSVNEKVALEVAAAGSYSGLRSLCTMKQVGVNVAADFLMHFAEYGTRAGTVLVSCEDPGALSSNDEGGSRSYCRMMEFPLLEPGDFQEAKDMAKWAFELSEAVNNVVMLRSVTRLSHASGNVTLGGLLESRPSAEFRFNGDITDQMNGPVLTFPPFIDHQRRRQLASLEEARELFEKSPFNKYSGPEQPELLIITSSAATFYCAEAIDLLGLGDRVGLLKLGTTWPLPKRLMERHLSQCSRVLVVEENAAFMEDTVKALVGELGEKVGHKEFFGRQDGTLPLVNELNPDLVAQGLAKIFGLQYLARTQAYSERANQIAIEGAPERSLTFCPGCPHRASYWLINQAQTLENRQGFVCGDIGCYCLGVGECGFNTLKTNMAMGSGMGMASGFGKLASFGMTQPVMAVSGDSTFFHGVIPGLINAIHNESDMILVVMDNSGTAMTGFQPHPGIALSVKGNPLPALDIPRICEAMGARVEVADPFDLASAGKILGDLMEDSGGTRVLVLQRSCALGPTRKGKKDYRVYIDQEACLGDACGCNRLCTRIFKCPGLFWDPVEKKTNIDEFVCAGCGVCAQICPQNAIKLEKAV